MWRQCVFYLVKFSCLYLLTWSFSRSLFAFRSCLTFISKFAISSISCILFVFKYFNVFGGWAVLIVFIQSSCAWVAVNTKQFMLFIKITLSLKNLKFKNLMTKNTYTYQELFAFIFVNFVRGTFQILNFCF